MLCFTISNYHSFVHWFWLWIWIWICNFFSFIGFNSVSVIVYLVDIDMTFAFHMETLFRLNSEYSKWLPASSYFRDLIAWADSFLLYALLRRHSYLNEISFWKTWNHKNSMAIDEKHAGIILKRVFETMICTDQISLISGQDEQR